MKLLVLTYLGQPMLVSLTMKQVNQYLSAVPEDILSRYSVSEVELASTMAFVDSVEECTGEKLSTNKAAANLLHRVAYLVTGEIGVGATVSQRDLLGQILYLVLVLGSGEIIDDMLTGLSLVGWRDDPIPSPVPVSQVLEDYFSTVMHGLRVSTYTPDNESKEEGKND